MQIVEKRHGVRRIVAHAGSAHDDAELLRGHFPGRVGEVDGAGGVGEDLGSTGWPIDRIARTCGFASAVTFRQNFVATYGTGS